MVIFTTTICTSLIHQNLRLIGRSRLLGLSRISMQIQATSSSACIFGFQTNALTSFCNMHFSQRPYKETRLAEVIKENGNVTQCEMGILKTLQNIRIMLQQNCIEYDDQRTSLDIFQGNYSFYFVSTHFYITSRTQFYFNQKNRKPVLKKSGIWQALVIL